MECFRLSCSLLEWFGSSGNMKSVAWARSAQGFGRVGWCGLLADVMFHCYRQSFDPSSWFCIGEWHVSEYVTRDPLLLFILIPGLFKLGFYC